MSAAEESKKINVEKGTGDEKQVDPVTAALTSATDEKEPNRKLTDEEIEEALNCPCIDKMREGACGEVFIDAYRCFLKSDAEPKGMDCIEPFAIMQKCMEEHADEYTVDEGDAEDSESSSVSDAPKSNQNKERAIESEKK